MLKFWLAMALWVLGEGGPGQMTLVSVPKLEGRGCTCVCSRGAPGRAEVKGLRWPGRKYAPKYAPAGDALGTSSCPSSRLFADSRNPHASLLVAVPVALRESPKDAQVTKRNDAGCDKLSCDRLRGPIVTSSQLPLTNPADKSAAGTAFLNEHDHSKNTYLIAPST